MGQLSGDKAEVHEEESNKGERKRSLISRPLSSLKEPEMLYEKTYICPACENEMKVKTVKQSKLRLMGTEMDMRPTYQNVDPLKYGAILCRKCGYAALNNYFDQISEPQIALIKTNISDQYHPKPKPESDCYSYDDALEIHKMALLNAAVKRSRPSERAYICLKLAWLYRGKAEEQMKNNPDEQKRLAEINKAEREYLAEANKGFISAIETESSNTICGMDIATVYYLCAALSYELGEYEEAQRTLSRVYSMTGIAKRTKDRCVDLKNLIAEKM